MKKRIILWIALAMLLSLGAVLSVSAQQADGSEDVINVTINGNPVTFQEGYGLPYVDNAWRTQVPLRAAMEAYGAYVDWDADARTAIVQYQGITVKLPVNQNFLTANGQIRTMDTQAVIRSGRTYLPIRFVVEALGGSVSWDQATLTVGIWNPSYPARQTSPVPLKERGVYDVYNNSLLIGDSRTQGIQAAAGISGADYFCENGLALRKVMSGGSVADGTYTVVEETDEEGNVTQKRVPNVVTLAEKLESKQYSRVFIILGFNDVGWQQPATFEKQYDQIIKQIRAAQPNAMVIAQKLIPVTAARSQTDRYFNNPAIAKYNQIIENQARANNILCVDPTWSVADDTGALAAAYSHDGIHLFAVGYKVWAQLVGRIVP